MKKKISKGLGIHITASKIDMALVQYQGKSMYLSRHIHAPMPAGVVKGNFIENPVGLVRILKDIIKKNRMKADQVAISAPTYPMILQIVDVPPNLTGSMRNFVAEIPRHYTVLAGQKVLFDYAGIPGLSKKGRKRILVSAAGGTKLSEFLGQSYKNNLSINIVEPEILPYARSVHSKRLLGRSKSNVLIGMLTFHEMTLSVWRNGNLDFIRTKEMPKDLASDELGEWVYDQLKAVLRFYELDMPSGTMPWEITLTVEPAFRTSIDTEGFIAEVPHIQSFTLRTPKEACLDLAVKMDEKTLVTELPKKSSGDNASKDTISPISVGLAMGALDPKRGGLSVNLMDPDVVKLQKAQEASMVAFATLAAGVVALWFIGAGLSYMAGNTSKELGGRTQVEMASHISGMMAEQSELLEKNDLLIDHLDVLKNVATPKHHVHWSQALDQIKSCIPSEARLTRLRGQDESVLLLEGVGITYDAINLYLDALNQTSIVESASLVGTEKLTDGNTGIKYTIRCFIRPDKES